MILGVVRDYVASYVYSDFLRVFCSFQLYSDSFVFAFIRLAYGFCNIYYYLTSSVVEKQKKMNSIFILNTNLLIVFLHEITNLHTRINIQ